jgi:hypothetical protein
MLQPVMEKLSAPSALDTCGRCVAAGARNGTGAGCICQRRDAVVSVYSLQEPGEERIRSAHTAVSAQPRACVRPATRDCNILLLPWGGRFRFKNRTLCVGLNTVTQGCSLTAAPRLKHGGRFGVAGTHAAHHLHVIFGPSALCLPPGLHTVVTTTGAEPAPPRKPRPLQRFRGSKKEKRVLEGGKARLAGTVPHSDSAQRA